tara:strand:- start:888 stop:2330 length:1443 start_codon:yes stop_codon:yes gene_type:complete
MNLKHIGFNFDNSYLNLPEIIYSKIKPQPVSNPTMVLFNYELAKKLNLDFSKIPSEFKSKIFSGNLIPNNTEPFSQAYAGHQFGHFTILGDGRASIIGEHLNQRNQRFDIQLKGSGKTPFSRNGDGRAALGPMLREYLISEALYHLGIPTTRSLAVVKTGESVQREIIYPGAILARVASSHIRVGTFQFLAVKNNLSDLENLLDYTINRHYSEIVKSKDSAIELLHSFMLRQIDLVVEWMRVGFVHGVMNTDNMTLSGESIDFGPCAFMNIYKPDTFFSSIDYNGRYSYQNQPTITQWNVARFAESIIPLINKNKETSIKLATEVINLFDKYFQKRWLEMMRSKLGLVKKHKDDKKLILELLKIMKEKNMDYTNTFRMLNQKKLYSKNLSFKNWFIDWQKRINHFGSFESSQKVMILKNPSVIPRNNLVEKVLNDSNLGDYKSIKDFLKILKKPYKNYVKETIFNKDPKIDPYYKTFCGT